MAERFSQLDDFFDDGAIERGLAYAAEGRVKIVTEERDGDEITLMARCRGSAGKTYSVHATITVDAGRLEEMVEGDCDCPIGGGCKHLVALIATALTGEGATRPRGMPPAVPAVLRGAAQPPPARPRRAAPERPERALEWELEDWLRRTYDRRRRPRSANDEVTLYIVDPVRRAVAPVHARRKKDGRFAAPASVSVQGYQFQPGADPPRYADPDDVTIMRLLRDAHQAEYAIGKPTAVIAAGPVGAVAMQRIVATGRACIGDLAVPLGPGATRAGRLLWRAARDAYMLVVSTDVGEVAVLPTDPLMYVDSASRECGVIDLPGPAERYSAILEMPAVPREQSHAFFSHWRRLQADATLAVALPDPPAEVSVEPPHPPRIVLAVRPTEFVAYARGKQRTESRLAGYPMAIYPEATVPAHPSAPFVSIARAHDGAAESIRVVRDDAAERNACAALERLGLHREYRYEDPEHPGAWLMGDCSIDAWRAGFARLASGASAAGIELDLPADFPVQMRTVADIDAVLDSSAPDGNWFTLDLGITLDGKRVSIARPIARWLREHPDPRSALTAEDGEHVLLALDDGTLLKVPRERIRALLAPLLEFGEPAVGDDGRLRMSRLDAALHPEWIAAARRFAAGLQAMRERLLAEGLPAEVAPAEGFGGALRPYQRAGLAWLQFLGRNGFGGILADDMGLGKTIQVLAHLHLERMSGRAVGPTLVVAPTSVLPNWREELARFTPDLRVVVLHGKDRAGRFDSIERADVVLTTYALLVRDGAALAGQRFGALVFDEAQHLKNAASRAREIAARLVGGQRILLTGTPLENNLGELWSLADLAQPGLLGGHAQFAARFRTPIEKQGDTERLAMLRARLRPFFLRRQRGDVLDELPPKTEVVRHVELEGPQRDLYEAVRLAADAELRAVIAERGLARSQIAVLDALLKLRQACCDPRLVKRPEAARAHGVSAKLELLTEMLSELAREERKVLVFSQFASMIDLIERALEPLGLRAEKLIGATALDARSAAVRRFQAGECDVFLISLRAGGTGINLTAADTVIHFDPWWNPAVEAQATARAHRMGQQKPVLVYKLIARGTVEERILALLERKQALAQAVLTGGSSGGALITEEDLAALLAPL